MKRASLLVVVLLVAGLLAACGGGGGGTGTPEGAAKAFLDAAAKGDVTRLKALTCADDVDTVEDDWSVPEDSTVDVSKLQYKTTESTQDTAVVQITGTMKMTYQGETQEQDMDETFNMVKENGQWKQCGN